MKQLLLILLCLPILTLAQKTYVPDDNFENYLEVMGMGDGIMLNDSVLTGSINTVTTLNVDNQNISDLTGIEAFSTLTYLNCDDNQLTSLDVSNNLALTHLYCPRNQLTSLDVSNNLALTDLSCSVNQLTSLDVSTNIALQYLYCVDNQLSSFDLRNLTLQNLNLTVSSLDLFCIDVDYPILAQVLLTGIDPWTSFDTNCVTALGCADTLAYNYDSTATINDGSCYYGKTYVPDDNFEAYLEAFGMGDGIAFNDSVLTGNINTVTSLSVNSQYISDLTGVEDYIALTYLDCSFNQLTILDVSNNLALTELYCYNNQLTSIDVSQNTALTFLWCFGNLLTILDVSNNLALTELYCELNQLTILDVSNNLALDHLQCGGYQLTSLDISGATALTYLGCHGSQLTSLDVSNNLALDYLECGGNQLTSLDVSNNLALMLLACDGNLLTTLDVSNNLALTYLDCSFNQLTSLDLRNQTLQNLNINTTSNQNLFCIDVNNPTLAQVLLTNIDPWTSFDTNCVTALGCIDTLAYNYDSTATINDGSCYYGKTYVPDDNFENYLEIFGLGDGIMLNDSVITGNINTITNLSVNNQNISDLTGIEDFTALAYLEFSNNQLANLDVSQNILLTLLSVEHNQLTSLDVSNNTALTHLYCRYNQLTSLDVSNNPALHALSCHHNQLTSIDVSQNTALINFSSDYNQLTSLDVSQNTALASIGLESNQLTSLNIGNNILITQLNTNFNPNLFCIDVDYPVLAQSQYTDIDPWTSFDTNCATALGCMDSLSCNYNNTATIADNSCTYLPVTLNSSQVTCTNFSNATLIVNYNTGSYTYLWSNGETTQSIDSLAMGSYSVIVTDTTGCSTSLNANVTLAPAPAFNMFPEICYVTVDSATGNNKVVVKPMANLLTSKFIIYKESSANIYSPIDTINSNALEHLDISSNPMAQSYRYKISVLDTCSNESVKSDFHKTIHLTMSLGVNGEVNLLWNTYEGYQPSDYLIFRSVNNGAMNQVSILPGTNLTYTDLTPPSGILNYQVRAIAPNCNIIPFAKSATNMLVSNVINHSTTAVNELVNSKKVIKITDLLGRETKLTNQPLFYIYDDGTVDKRIVIE
jgi:Leucine-rich repeat (LRR) protein